MRTSHLRSFILRLVGALLLAMAALNAGLSYLQLRQLSEDQTQLLSKALSAQVAQTVNQLIEPASMSLALLARSPALRSGSLPAWLAHLPQLATMLQSNPAAVSLYVGGPDGQYLNLRELQGPADRAHFQAPAQAAFTVQAQRVRGSTGPQQTLLHYDAQWRPLGPSASPLGDTYDPRTRPWFKQAQALQAQQSLVRTAPYTFFSSGQPGITLARAASAGWVFGIDIRLTALAKSLQTLAQARGVQLAIVDTHQAVLASAGPSLLPPAVTVTSHPASGPAINKAVRTPLPDGQVAWRVEQSLQLPGAGDLKLIAVMPASLFDGPMQQARMNALISTVALLVLGALAAGWSAQQLSAPLTHLTQRARSVLRFDFHSEPVRPTGVQEIEELGQAFEQMSDTLRHFLDLLHRVASETDFERLLGLIVTDTAQVLQADAAQLYLRNAEDTDWALRARTGTPTLTWTPRWQTQQQAEPSGDAFWREALPQGGEALLLPLRGRRGAVLGLLAFERSERFDAPHAQFAHALSVFAALALESRELIAQQRQLFDAFVKLIAEAVDAKSPHTGGHCHRVPTLTEMLVDLAATSKLPELAQFRPDADQREAIHIAAWLHDCGKVATPESVVDKATKLETLYDRIHEVRMRFELCKREAELAAWQAACPEGLRPDARTQLTHRLTQLDEDFAFVASCNLGSEAMDPASQARLRTIAQQTWTRTLDDRLGLSPSELARRAGQLAPPLPVQEPLLSDRPEHRVARPPAQQFGADNPWGFHIQLPEWMYDRGELKNLCIGRGTLTDEDRYKINEHIVLTIRMLEALPFPRHLREVPAIAGGHHERMDGHGYPRGVPAGTLSVPARLMAIADVFEALTACDRPYKQGKSVSEALAIMRGMCAQQHFDPVLFELFAQSDVPARYAREFLAPWQMPAEATAAVAC